MKTSTAENKGLTRRRNLETDVDVVPRVGVSWGSPPHFELVEQEDSVLQFTDDTPVSVLA